ncbi:PP2C family protein-serine/threonine phosphatase [Actinomadura kijaniata]|uniref:PP2C family protein-serine/threonine phosphatase n=1 Tax=Actinomadura kijaniata TaxID=46161 RepID=UPI003F1AAE33
MIRSHHGPSRTCGNLPTVLAAAGGALAAVTAVDLALPASCTVLALLVAVPALGALWPVRDRHVLLVGAVDLVCALPLLPRHWTDLPHLVVTVPLGVACTTGVVALAVHRRTRAADAEADAAADLRVIAETMQRAVLRPVPPRVGRVRAQVRYLAAAGPVQVGGDLYDVLETPFGTRVIIGDVMGKGLTAVEKAIDVLGAFRELARREPELPGLAGRLDDFLAVRDPDQGFVTALIAEVPADSATVRLVCCGHPPPLVLSGGRVAFVDDLPSSPPLGLLRLSAAEGRDARDPCPAGAVTLGAGDRLLLYTDGVTEARDADGDFYPLAERAARIARQGHGRFLDRLKNDLVAHGKGRRQDDAALLLLEFDHAAAPAEATVR